MLDRISESRNFGGNRETDFLELQEKPFETERRSCSKPWLYRAPGVGKTAYHSDARNINGSRASAYCAMAIRSCPRYLSPLFRNIDVMLKVWVVDQSRRVHCSNVRVDSSGASHESGIVQALMMNLMWPS